MNRDFLNRHCFRLYSNKPEQSVATSPAGLIIRHNIRHTETKTAVRCGALLKTVHDGETKTEIKCARRQIWNKITQNPHPG